MVRWPKIGRHYMENTGNGPEVMDALRTAHRGYEVSEEISGELAMTPEEKVSVENLRRRGMPGIIPVNPKGDKTARGIAVTGTIEAGDVHVSESAPWLPTFLEELAAFPNGAHDDIVDSTTQAILKLRRKGRAGGARLFGEELRTTRASGV
jgi:predicted phage terminase large subunit-like protein